MLAAEGGWANVVKRAPQLGGSTDRFELARYIVEHTSVDLDLVDSGGFNATDIAAIWGFYSEQEKGFNSNVADIVNYLKDHGLEYTWRGAIIGGDFDRINDFLENGQDIEERTGYYCEGGYQMTGVQMAFKYGRFAVARYLMVLGGPAVAVAFGTSTFLKGKGGGGSLPYIGEVPLPFPLDE
ncbi:unnamed protein product [Prorocentrum cordatum]|uniref:Subtilisin n=1 Tax=Prorocentrum cordatum TaxID=2364126 RepID=A0ABN9XPQ9_9DINO|nr:unnamed protein product [Polarella glacialis]